MTESKSARPAFGKVARTRGWQIAVGSLLGAILGLAVIGPSLSEISVSKTPTSPKVVAPSSPQTVAPVLSPRSAQFGDLSPPAEVRGFADWIARARDAGINHYAIIDKVNARVYLFDPDARLQATSPVLLGAAHGDDSVPGIGDRPLSAVRPEERTTPAGRFIAEVGHNTHGEDIIWVDYDAAVSMHRVRAGNTRERRLERLASATSSDNRISYGCINVPADFYDRHVRPALSHSGSLVYVMPDTKTLAEVFPNFSSVSGALPPEPAIRIPASFGTGSF